MSHLTYLFLVSICLASSSVYSQSKSPDLTVAAGANLTSFRGNEFVTKGNFSLPGYSLNANLLFPVANDLRLGTGVQFEKIGRKIKNLLFTDQFGNLAGKGDVTDKLNYLTIPLYLDYTKGTKIRYGFEGGIFGSYLLSRKIKSNLVEPSPSGAQGEIVVVDEGTTSKFNGGLLFGAHVQFPLVKKYNLRLGIRDQFGLLNMSNVSGGPAIQSNVLTLLAGINIPL